ncbi:MAG: phosphatase PAP2 family protein [Nitrospinae bacterium]|nr:phosphatase PAP2 family protein [Nitrospinota bacterium]
MAGLNEALFWAVNGAHSDFADYIMFALTSTGYTVPAFIIAMVACRFYGGLSKRTVVVLMVALALGGGVVHGLKHLFPEDRPLAYFAKKTPPPHAKVHAPFERHKTGSFPSGHTQTAFSVAMFLVLLFRRHAVLWFLWACAVGVSRVYLGVHFPVDALVGALVGTTATYLVFSLSKTSKE